MMWFSTTIAILIFLFIINQAKELHGKFIIDPLSMHMDAGLYRLCWKQWDSQPIIGREQASQNLQSFTPFPAPYISNQSFCIQRKDKEKTYRIVFKLISDTQGVEMQINFGRSLGPVLKLIRFQTVPKGIYFQMNYAFAGVSLYSGPNCYIFMEGIQTNQTIYKECRMDNYREKTEFWPVENVRHFNVYYTCTLMETRCFSSSTYFTKESGQILQENSSTLEPIVQMPLRRFIKVVWKHADPTVELYLLVIYDNVYEDQEKCLKIFRIFNRKTIRKSKTKIHNCAKDVPVEDIGYFQNETASHLHAILDMIDPLKENEKYKLSIFWQISKNQLFQNYIYFNTLSHENSGRIKKIFFNFKAYEYKMLRNEISSMVQDGLSKNNENPVLLGNFGKHLNVENFSYQMLLSSVVDNVTESEREHLTISEINEQCKQLSCSKAYYPYYYAVFREKADFDGKDAFSEIVQIPIISDKGPLMELSDFVINNDTATMFAKWKLQNFPDTVTPAYYLIEIMEFLEDDYAADQAILLECRTCSSVYKRESMSFLRDKYLNWEVMITKGNLSVLNNVYDAIDSEVSFTMPNLKRNVSYKTTIYGFTSTKFTQMNRKIFSIALQSTTSKPGTNMMTMYFIIGIISILLIISFIFSVMCALKSKLCRNILKDKRNGHAGREIPVTFIRRQLVPNKEPSCSSQTPTTSCQATIRESTCEGVYDDDDNLDENYEELQERRNSETNYYEQTLIAL